MYPIDVFPLWLTLIGALGLGCLGFWVSHKDGSARPLGLTALVVALASGWCWFSSLPEWTAWLTAMTVFTLFTIGMLRPEHQDDKWHYSAMIVALAGKLAIWTLPLIWAVLTGKVDVKFQLQGWMILILALGVVIGVALGFSERFRLKAQRWAFWKSEPEPATT